MTKTFSSRVLGFYSDNPKSKACAESRRSTQHNCSLFPTIENPKSTIQNVVAGLFAIVVAFMVCGVRVEAQQPKAYRVGVLLPGETWHEIVDGLRVGLRELRFEEGKQFVLSIRDWKGDAKVAEEAARKLEQEKVALIYATSTNSAIAARRATAEIPIVFCAGTDPVVLGLVDSFANPGGRLTGATTGPLTLPRSAWSS
jgi:ABC-type uncharacterized transport system substrate-binding protein